MMIYRFNEFLINEAKYYLTSNTFRVKTLYDMELYPVDMMDKWKALYKVDDWAICVFVTTSKTNISIYDYYDIRKSHRGIKNVKYFNSESDGKDGFFIEDSEMDINGERVYLYIFKKNSNIDRRARQIHGFIYEGEIKRKNKLYVAKDGYTSTWDGYGELSKDFINERENNGRVVECYKKGVLVPYDDFIEEAYHWSIKTVKNGSEINLGDFSRIHGLRYVRGVDGEESLVRRVSRVKYFMFNVGVHENGKVYEEYFVKMPVDVWNKYSKVDLHEVQSMYDDLWSHRLRGERTEESERLWREFINKYKNISINNIIKIRFKRSSKGQLRIQCAISLNNFKKMILNENLSYIKIYENEKNS